MPTVGLVLFIFAILVSSGMTFYDNKEAINKIKKEAEKEKEEAVQSAIKKVKKDLEGEKQKLIFEKNIIEAKKKTIIECSEMFAELFADRAVSFFDSARNYFLRKKRIAKSSAEITAQLKRDTKAEIKKYKKYQYIIENYERMFPWLIDFKEEPVENTFLEETSIDNSDEEYIFSKYLNKEEMANLSRTEKFQRSLERYTHSHNKTNWQIGLFYERYIGYLYETALGYKVIMNGAKERWQDMGIDLIATKNGKTELIQCKYWSKEKTIYEKYIFQLFGTTINYICENYPNIKDPVSLIRNNVVKPVFITSTDLSDKARIVAKSLNVELREKHGLDWDYPKIKCNPNSATGERIYHLPFDQQYDNFQVSQSEGAFYAKTVKEAEEKGFRRSYRWHSKTNNKEGL